MRYSDLMDALRESHSRVTKMRAIAYRSPAETRDRDLSSSARRQYVVGHVVGPDWAAGRPIVVEVSVSAYGPRISLIVEPWDVVTDIRSDTMARATEAVRHIEAWIKGEVADLAPSGPWPPSFEAESKP